MKGSFWSVKSKRNRDHRRRRVHGAGDCADNCTISALDVTWVKKHLTQGFLCQLFCGDRAVSVARRLLPTRREWWTQLRAKQKICCYFPLVWPPSPSSPPLLCRIRSNSLHHRNRAKDKQSQNEWSTSTTSVATVPHSSVTKLAQKNSQ